MLTVTLSPPDMCFLEAGSHPVCVCALKAQHNVRHTVVAHERMTSRGGSGAGGSPGGLDLWWDCGVMGLTGDRVDTPFFRTFLPPLEREGLLLWTGGAGSQGKLTRGSCSACRLFK